jgi:hypothetical protein
MLGFLEFASIADINTPTLRAQTADSLAVCRGLYKSREEAGLFVCTISGEITIGPRTMEHLRAYLEPIPATTVAGHEHTRHAARHSANL